VKNDEIVSGIFSIGAGVIVQSELAVTVAIDVGLATDAVVTFELPTYTIKGKAVTSNNRITKYLSMDFIFNLAVCMD
jgi:hypothetical protein